MGTHVRFSRKQRLAVAIGLVAVVAAGVAGGWWYATRLPKRFAAVVDGRLYRSGEVTPGHLARLQRDYGVGRVISLLNGDAPVSVAEREAAGRLGLTWVNVPLGGDGASRAEDRQRLLALLDDPNAPPTLVHCAAGVNRTGLAVGLYRLHCQHWTLEQVMDEMRRFGFDDLPKHDNLRMALASEADAAAAARAMPAE